MRFIQLDGQYVERERIIGVHDTTAALENILPGGDITVVTVTGFSFNKIVVRGHHADDIVDYLQNAKPGDPLGGW